MSESDERSRDAAVWCDECRARVGTYLSDQAVVHGRIGESPAWCVPFVMSVWGVESIIAPGWVGWWVLCGDGPTDYVSAQDIRSPRGAVRTISKRWATASTFLGRGENPPDSRLGSPDSRPQLAPLLQSRAELLLRWVDDNSVWIEE
jgi:hypothetical protein